MSPLAARLAERIERGGPLGFDEYVDAALYDPDGGFFATGGRAGRRGDFLTSPEVGPLFGAVVARALDAWWDVGGRRRPFVVVDAGAGPGTLARSLLAARPACAEALVVVLVERTAAQRALHHGRGLTPVSPAEALADGAPPGPHVVSIADLAELRHWASQTAGGVVLANELLDNVAPTLLERGPGTWREVRVGLDGAGAFVEVLADVPDDVVAWANRVAPEAPPGGRVPLQAGAAAWLREACAQVPDGRVVVFDTADVSASLAERPWRSWLRTYRDHEPGGEPLEAPGSQDIVCEVAVDQLLDVSVGGALGTQAGWLHAWGIEELVDEGREIWNRGASQGHLAALAGRSRVREAEALCDPQGLGAFTVLELPTRRLDRQAAEPPRSVE